MYEPRQNCIDYIEMPSRDLGATKRFFGALFGWTFQDYGPDYTSFDDGRIAGGFFAAGESWTSSENCPLVVFHSMELELTRADVVRLGGTITKEIFEFPGGRRFHFSAPGSGEFAVWSES